MSLFEVADLRLAVPDLAEKRPFRAAPSIEILRGLSFAIAEGASVGIVGESGSGKSTLGRALVRLMEPTGGTIRFRGEDITHRDAAAMRPLRRDLQVIFQDPSSSLNPRHTVGRIIAGPLRFHGVEGVKGRVAAVLEEVGLPAQTARRYPHELSGGQRQRVGIARAVALSPRFIFADEIVSGLDTSTQAQVIALIERLRADHGLTLAFVSHDLSVVRHLCERLIVLQNGRIVEEGDTATIFEAPQHPHTQALKAAIPLPEVEAGWLG
ncbi:ATP-binding cassette domain-containing protein [Acuticoccus mangrovi]|uniref:ATP-binding cassette domain-containing protein n=1 Tax=Acuticoccus mangrovi TaxID=2796142 RepID=A0A934IU94_9HYPH|nr:ATP-binding cassette domain-containing protein [Acuticoccus mangrovi]MBJ3777834.1 ATP-binding cassette domain-containing protein [Acuticoccus mangrovi]